MDSPDMDSPDWLNGTRPIVYGDTDNRISLNVLLGHSASTWMNDWTLYGIHILKLVTGLDKSLDRYKDSWEDFLLTDPDCESSGCATFMLNIDSSTHVFHTIRSN